MEIPHKEDFRGTPLGWDHNNEPIPGLINMGQYCAALQKYAVEATLEAIRDEDKIRGLEMKIRDLEMKIKSNKSVERIAGLAGIPGG